MFVDYPIIILNLYTLYTTTKWTGYRWKTNLFPFVLHLNVVAKILCFLFVIQISSIINLLNDFTLKIFI